MTGAERRAQLLAAGYDRPLVEEMIAEESVGGVWCDGAIVNDANGRRCVSRATIDRVSAARASSPLPSPAGASSPLPRALLFAGAAALVVGLVVAVRR